MPNVPLRYRRDIDGLRGVAVLAVVGFHAFPALIRGGFVGVDVFFVISGFLISGIIFGSLEKGSLSFREFYVRRIRRIFPALILVLAACYVFGSAALDPYTFQVLAKDIVAGATFLSNFQLWQESGYFATAANTKPLLHLWSLGIEEQFYLFWPVVAYFIWRSRAKRLLLVVTVCGASFLWNVAQSHLDAVGAFYSPLTRLWELLIGAATALIVVATGFSPPKSGEWASSADSTGSTAAVKSRSLRFGLAPNVQATVGVLLILTALFSLSKDSPFPSWRALYPTIGTALLLIAGTRGAWINGQFLAHRILVWFGLISYPLYLWHWPLLWIMRAGGREDLPVSLTLGVVATSIGLAWLTYQLLERPLRSGASGFAKATALTCAMAAIAAVALHAYVGTTDYMAARNRSYANNLAQLSWIENDTACIKLIPLAEESKTDAVFCHLSDPTRVPTVAILGDSTAEHLYPGMAKLYGTLGDVAINLGVGTCAPFNHLHGHFSWNRNCDRANRKIYDYVIRTPSIKTVILGIAPWDIRNMEYSTIDKGSSLSARFDAIAPLVAADLAELVNAGKSVVVTFDSPHIGVDPRSCFKHVSIQECSVPGAAVRSRMEPYVSSWRKVFLQHPEVCVFKQDPLFLKGDSYRILKDGLLLFRDDHHLSFHGSDVVAEAFFHSPCLRRASGRELESHP